MSFRQFFLLFLTAFSLTSLISNELISDDETLQIDKKNAGFAASKMQKLLNKKILSKKELYDMALFIETKLLKNVIEGDRHYFSRLKTGLARSIEIDPTNGKVYIHLKTHGIKQIGYGARKIVTTSIAYSTTNPEFVAYSETSYPNENESQAILDLQGLPCLVKTYSVLKRTTKKGEVANSFVTKHYKRGTLTDCIRAHKRHIAYQQKLSFAKDILKGLKVMHERGYAHRDIGPNNIFVERRGKRLGLVLADFGRAVFHGKTTERSAHAGVSLSPPEALDHTAISDDAYLATDIYAAGCILHRLLFSERPTQSPPWYDKNIVKDFTRTASERSQWLTESLNKYRTKRAAFLKKKYAKRKSSTRLRFEQVILKMIHPDPEKRITASEAYQWLTS